MATVDKRGSKWWVKWREPSIIIDDTGANRKHWVTRSRTFVSKVEAEQFARDRENDLAAGKTAWRPENEKPSVTIRKLMSDWANAPKVASTKEARRSMVGRVIRFAGDRRVSDLSAPLLREYAAHCIDAGILSVDRYVGAVTLAWKWGVDGSRRDQYPGLPSEHVSIVGSDTDSVVSRRETVQRTAVPTLEEVDRMISNLRSERSGDDSYRRVAVIQRYSGLRISQATNLHWKDIYLDDPDYGPYMLIHKGSPGTKKGKGRALPLHPALAAEMATWGVREGYVFPRREKQYRDNVRDALRKAWIAAGVPRAKWDKPEDPEPGDRVIGAPSHTLKAALIRAMTRARVDRDAQDYLVAHKADALRGAYVPRMDPAGIEGWDDLREAIGAVPAYDPRTVAVPMTRAIK